MTWEEAVAFARQIGCRHALAAALESKTTAVPAADQPAEVLCKEKVRLGIAPDICDFNCPEVER